MCTLDSMRTCFHRLTEDEAGMKAGGPKLASGRKHSKLLQSTWRAAMGNGNPFEWERAPESRQVHKSQVCTVLTSEQQTFTQVELQRGSPIEAGALHLDTYGHFADVLSASLPSEANRTSARRSRLLALPTTIAGLVSIADDDHHLLHWIC